MSHEAVDHYIDSIFTRYQTELREQLGRLRDPAAVDTSLACRRLECMTETLTAFAVGHSVGRVVEAMRRIDSTLLEPMAQAIASVKAPAMPAVLPAPKFFADDGRPIVNPSPACSTSASLSRHATHVRSRRC